MKTVPPTGLEPPGTGEGTPGGDASLLVEVLVAQAEILRVQADLIRSSPDEDQDGRLRDLSPLGR
jgi:hypothetical protein